MAVTINASTSAGLVQTADTSGVLALQTAGTTAVTVDASQNVGIGTAAPDIFSTGFARNLGVFISGGGTTSGINVSGGAASRIQFGVGTTRYGLIYQDDTNFMQIATTTALPISFLTNNVERIRIPSNASGITFPATQVASADANTLDDYEEGTWTPSLGGTATYDIRTGTYTKIGNVVSITGSIRPSSLGTGSTNTLTGLPFTAASDAFCGITFGDGWAVSVYSVHLYISGTSLEVRGFTAASTSTSLVNLFQTNARIYFSATYQV